MHMIHLVSFFEHNRIDAYFVVKVGDFGLSRDAYETSYYKVTKPQHCPVKWMPPEMLRDGISTEKSDVVRASHRIALIVHGVL